MDCGFVDGSPFVLPFGKKAVECFMAFDIGRQESKRFADGVGAAAKGGSKLVEDGFVLLIEADRGSRHMSSVIRLCYIGNGRSA